MAATPSTMVPLGTEMPSFSLPDPTGAIVSSDDLARSSPPAVLIVFMCNHCPFVKLVKDGLQTVAREYGAKGVAVIGINSNDVENYPDDSPEKMAAEGYVFPYLFDETQAVARSFEAACTPDFFIYDRDRKLAYRGQFDDARPKSDVPVTGADVRAALDAVIAGEPVPEPQKPSIGCNIKWRQ